MWVTSVLHLLTLIDVFAIPTELLLSGVRYIVELYLRNANLTIFIRIYRSPLKGLEHVSILVQFDFLNKKGGG